MDDSRENVSGREKDPYGPQAMSSCWLPTLPCSTNRWKRLRIPPRNVSLRIPAGTSIALVGASGAGKTTLVSMLLRFYDPLLGRIALDGIDLRALTLKSLRQNIALVLQEPVLFSASIRENIAYALPGTTIDQIKAAAQAAGAHNFIEALPDGYETEIGEQGVGLSGGQRQCLSIARAFLKDAPVLILDEPTSALDTETEALLLESIERLMKGRTTIIIAHRLSTIRNADQVIVLKDGMVVEAGTQAELLRQMALSNAFTTASLAHLPMIHLPIRMHSS